LEKRGLGNPGLHHPEGDRVVILEDHGRRQACAIRRRVFVQDKDLGRAARIAVIGTRRTRDRRSVLSCCSPLDLRLRTPTATTCGEEEVFLTGFGGQATTACTPIVVGPDGAGTWRSATPRPHIVDDRAMDAALGSTTAEAARTRRITIRGFVSDDGKV